MSPNLEVDFPGGYTFPMFGRAIAAAISQTLSLDGILYDSEGRYYPNTWLSSAASATYAARAQCLVQQADQLCHPEIPDNPCVDGSKALKYSIAENIGLHATFEAYAAWSRLDGSTARWSVPDGNSTEQLDVYNSFLLAYTRGLCSDQDSLYYGFTIGIIDEGLAPPMDVAKQAFDNFPSKYLSCPIKQPCAMFTGNWGAL